MSSFPSVHYGSYGDEKVVRTAQGGIPLGQLMQLRDGSWYRYCLTGEALGAGNVSQNPLLIANHDMDLVVAATVAAGVTSFTATLGNTLATINQYAGGYVYINDGPGEGHRYHVQGHDAVASGQVITVRLDEPLAEGLTITTSLCGLVANPYNGALLWNASPDGVPTGVCSTELASGEFGWLQTRGWGTVLIEGTAVVGKTHVPSLSTTGAVGPHVATGDAGPGIFTLGGVLAAGGDSGWGYITIE